MKTETKNRRLSVVAAIVLAIAASASSVLAQYTTCVKDSDTDTCTAATEGKPCAAGKHCLTNVSTGCGCRA